MPHFLGEDVIVTDFGEIPLKKASKKELRDTLRLQSNRIDTLICYNTELQANLEEAREALAFMAIQLMNQSPSGGL